MHFNFPADSVILKACFCPPCPGEKEGAPRAPQGRGRPARLKMATLTTREPLSKREKTKAELGTELPFGIINMIFKQSKLQEIINIFWGNSIPHRPLQRHHFYLRRSRQIRERKAFFFFFFLLLLLGGDYFSSSHVQFFGVCTVKAKTLSQKGWVKANFFSQKGWVKAKTLSQKGWEKEKALSQKGCIKGKTLSYIGVNRQKLRKLCTSWLIKLSIIL